MELETCQSTQKIFSGSAVCKQLTNYHENQTENKTELCGWKIALRTLFGKEECIYILTKLS